MDEIFIKATGVSYSFEEKNLLRDVDLSIEKGKIYAVIGPNGGGKTVLLKLIAGVYEPSEGNVEVFAEGRYFPMQKAVSMHKVNVGFVFEHGCLMSNMTIFENVALSMRYFCAVPEAEIEKKSREIIEYLGLGEYADSRPAQLSLGLKKRANLAAAIVNRPQLLIYDNPTLGLDVVNSKAIKSLISRIHSEYNTASVTSTNSMHFVCDVADKVIFVDGNTVLVEDSPENVLKSEHPKVREYLCGFSCSVRGDTGGGWAGE